MPDCKRGPLRNVFLFKGITYSHSNYKKVKGIFWVLFEGLITKTKLKKAKNPVSTQTILKLTSENKNNLKLMYIKKNWRNKNQFW